MLDLIKSLLTPISDILREYLLKHVCYIIQVGDNVEALNREAKILEDLRKDVEEQIKRDETSLKKPTNKAEGWLKRVEALQPKLESISRDYNSRKWVCLGTCSFNCFSNHNIGMRAAEELVNVKEEVKLINDARNDQEVTAGAPPPTVQEVPTTTLAAPGGEIELKFRLALDFLRDDAKGMLGVWGMGGVGKTTLLKHINNAMVKDTSFGFDRVVFVIASRGCTMGKIQMSIAKELGLPEGGDHFRNISNYLRNKSFLILVDDLWEFLDIEEMGIPLPLGVIEEHKRKMILVSRSQKTLHDMGISQSIKVECLSRDAARLLFRENVGAEDIWSNPRITVTTISNLQKLVQLSAIPISSLFLKEMEDLDSSIEFFSHEFLGSQHIRSNLKKLILSHCTSVKEVVVEGKHQLNIEILTLYGVTGLKEIRWKQVETKDVLHKLRQVEIFDCNALKSIEWVMYLPCLELLWLWGCNEMEQMFGEEAGAAGTKQEEEDMPTFPSLRTIYLSNMPKLSSICHRPLTFPSLEFLFISDCTQLKKLPFRTPSSCTKLREIHCDEKTWNGIDLEDNMQATLKPLLKK